MKPVSINARMIAPCGIDCGACIGHLRPKKQCPGCLGPDEGKVNHCITCRLKNCPGLASSGSCPKCSKFPCARLRQLDKRYRTKYGASPIDNLKHIESEGLEAFVVTENARWTCSGCGARLSMHRATCLECGKPNPHLPQVTP